MKTQSVATQAAKAADKIADMENRAVAKVAEIQAKHEEAVKALIAGLAPNVREKFEALRTA